ncbi:vWA domain-containing protein, partial [Streptomyces caniscabiei]|uniref:hypothetical protein n=1 Tax=Streptomyces caniscabiei TaxID=2746961 RepID=UPI0038F7EF3F
TSYALSLFNADYSANGIVVVITDGLDNNSKATENSVKKAIDRAHQSEALESLITILIGVNMKDSSAKFALEQYAKNVGFTDFIAVEDADENTLAKIANYVSQSISSQS